MKFKIVKFKNNLYGVRRNMFLLGTRWLNYHGLLTNRYLSPSEHRDVTFLNVKECESAIEKYKKIQEQMTDKGKFVKKIKI